MRQKPFRRVLRIAAVCCIAASGLQAATTRTLASLPPVIVTGVAVDNSSVKIDYQPVPGAKDYRAFDLSDPMMVKYAGMTHLEAGPGRHFVLQPDGVTPVFPYTSTVNTRTITAPATLDVPSTEIQWNMVDDRQPHVLVVQAVDALGPVPPGSLTDANDAPINAPAGMLGSGEGPTPDGNISINGQGPSTNNPQVIAQSTPFTVQADGSVQPIPSRPDAVQTFFDTFDSGEAATLQRAGGINPISGTMTYTLNAGTSKAWEILYHGADTDHSRPFVMDGHFMDVLFDGMTPGSLPPAYAYAYHTQYSSMSLSPVVTADLSNGKLLHMTAEVDGHMDQTFRWLAWQLAPANDPLTSFHADNTVTSGFASNANSTPINTTNRALWLQVFPKLCDAMLFEGPQSITNTAPMTNPFVPEVNGGIPPCYHTTHWGGNGIGLDNRERWDVFITTHHLALFEDGTMIMQSDIPDGGLPFDQAKLYFTHYLYATADQFEQQHLQTSEPWETYWLNYFPHSDERHWDNMGFEVLPAADVPTDWSTLSALIHLPPVVPPTFTSDPLMPMTTPMPMPSTSPATATPTSMPPTAPTATSTPVPPTATRTPTPPSPTATRTVASPSPTPSATRTVIPRPHAPSATATQAVSPASATPTMTTAAHVPASTPPPSTHTALPPTATPTAHGMQRHVPAVTPPRRRVSAPSTARSPLRIDGVAMHPSTPRPGRTALLRARVTARSRGANYTIVFRVRNARGHVVWQTRRGPLASRAGRARVVTVLWRVPRTLARGRYNLDVQAQKVSPRQHTAPRRPHHTTV